MSYFITAIAYYPECSDERYNKPYNTTRTFGHFGSLNDAKQAVDENRCDMNEMLYNYIVIENIPYGIHSIGSEQHWFKWYNKLGWKPIKKQKWAKEFLNWAI